MRPLVYESIFVPHVLIIQQSVGFLCHDRIPERNRVALIPFRFVIRVDGDEDLFRVPRKERSQIEPELEIKRRFVVYFVVRVRFLSVCVRGNRSKTFDGFDAQKHVRFRSVPNVRDGREHGDQGERGGREGEEGIGANPNRVTHSCATKFVFVCVFFCGLQRQKGAKREIATKRHQRLPLFHHHSG